VEFNLADLFECVADSVPDDEAVVWGSIRWTYAGLDEEATRFANGLAALGLGAGDHVGIALRDRPEHLQAMLGCYKLRAVPINVNYRYVSDELHYLCEDADLAALIAAPDQLESIGSALPRVAIELDGPSAHASAGVIPFETVAAGDSTRAFGQRSGDDHYILYTGGTTGMPKGVVWRQEDIFFAAMGGGNPGGPPIAEPSAIRASVLGNRAGRVRPFLAAGQPPPEHLVTLAIGPLVHASGQWSALGTLLAGGTVVLFPDEHVDAARVLDVMAAERVVACNVVGDAIARPMIELLESQPGRWDLSALLLLGSGGSIFSGDVKDRMLAAIPSLLAIIDGIGSSESPAQAVAVTTRGRTPTTSLRFSAKPTTMVVDESLRPIPPGSGVPGRLATTGHVPLGYYKDLDRSARTFVEIDGKRWSLPGDMAVIDADGTVRLLGRGSQCINTGGEKVYPEEVEAVLKRHDAIEDALVIGVPDERWGQRVCALVEPAGDDDLTLDAVQEHCRGKIAGYKVPRQLRVVDRIERLPNGKADYAWVAETLATPTG
jgi:fatty-acyl-CoA synthase